MHGHEATQEAASTRAEESQMHQIRLCFEGVNDETYEVTHGGNVEYSGGYTTDRDAVEETVSSLNAQEGGSA